MARLFLAVWLGAFAVQTSDLLILAAGDDCVEAATGSASDPCPQDCARCTCCARVAAFVTTMLAAAPADVAVSLVTLRPTDVLLNPPLHGILHVPKDSLT